MNNNIKTGDWINIIRDDGVIFNTLQYDGSDQPKHGYSFELWEPKIGELICFYQPKDKNKYFVTMISPFTGEIVEKDGRHITEAGFAYFAIAPLEFIQTIEV